MGGRRLHAEYELPIVIASSDEWSGAGLVGSPIIADGTICLRDPSCQVVGAYERRFLSSSDLVYWASGSGSVSRGKTECQYAQFSL